MSSVEIGTDGINTTRSDWFHTECCEGRDKRPIEAVTRKSEKSSVGKLHLILGIRSGALSKDGKESAQPGKKEV